MLKARYRPDIDGLRAVAILAVVAFHGFPTILPGGFVGVDVFFVISGFLISAILFNNLETGTFSPLNFYGRRVRRICPALILILSVSLIAGWLFFLPVDFEALSWQVLSSSLFASNFFFWQQAGYFDTSAETKMLLHLWSLGVEEQFYILWPIMLYAAHRWRFNKWIPIGVTFFLSFTVNLVFVHRAPVATFYLPFSRLWELALGGLLAYAFSHPRTIVTSHTQLASKVAFRTIRDIAGLTGMALLIYPAVRFTAHDRYPRLRALCPTLGAALLLSAGERSLINQLLGTRLLVSIGLISYPLYMWHWPLLVFVRTYATEALSQVAILEVIALSVLLAWLTYLVVETPIRFKSIHKRRVAQQLLGVLGCITLFAGFGIISRGLPQRLPPMLRILDNKFTGDWTSTHWHTHCFKGPGQDFPDSCIDKEPENAPLLALLGDSHAASLYPGIRDLQKTHPFRLVESTTISCPFILNYIDPVTPGAGPDVRDQCNAGNFKTLNRLASLHPDAVILLSSWWRYSLSPPYHWKPEVLSELTSTVAALKAIGIKKIILMGPLPTWDPKYLSKLMSDAWRHTPTEPLPVRMSNGLASNLPEINATLKQVAQREGIIFVAPMDYFCNPDGCLTKLGDGPDDLTTWDDAHLTPVASRYLLNAIEPILLRGKN